MRSSSVTPALSPLQQRLKVAREQAKAMQNKESEQLVVQEQPEQPRDPHRPQAPQQQPRVQPLSPVHQRLQAARECAAMEREAFDRGNRLAAARAAAKAGREAASDASDRGSIVIRSSRRCGACMVM